MTRIPVRYVSALMDHSGYGSAARSYIGALLESDKLDLTLTAVTFEQQKTHHGQIEDQLRPLINKKIDYKINIIHLTPENYPSHIQAGKYNIAYTTWETDKLPDNWIALCNLMDEIWVPSDWNIEVFKNSGVNKRIFKIPHGIALPNLTNIKNIPIEEDPSVFIFYSIFQWIERKNPVALLKAYLTEFSPEEKVCLAIKSYRLDTSGKEQEAIKEDILRVKKAINLPVYPPILFYGNLLSDDYLKGFHMRGDCFVLPHRAEGFGIPHAEAMSFGKPVISTRYGGNLEFMNKNNSYLIDYQMTPVSGMLFGNYHGHMVWADPDIMHLRKLMRYVYENQEEAKKLGMQARQDIEKYYNWQVISDLMIKRLREING